MILAALLLAASSPAERAADVQIAKCRIATLRALEGDTAFLDRYLKAARLSRAEEARIRAVCIVYFKGALDGLEIAKHLPPQ